jgi:hypothetical protein
MRHQALSDKRSPVKREPIIPRSAALFPHSARLPRQSEVKIPAYLPMMPLFSFDFYHEHRSGRSTCQSRTSFHDRMTNWQVFRPDGVHAWPARAPEADDERRGLRSSFGPSRRAVVRPAPR